MEEHLLSFTVKSLLLLSLVLATCVSNLFRLHHGTTTLNHTQIGSLYEKF